MHITRLPGEGVHSIGPVFVDPLNSNHGVGTAIVAAIRDHALNVDNASSIRLVQVILILYILRFQWC